MNAPERTMKLTARIQKPRKAVSVLSTVGISCAPLLPRHVMVLSVPTPHMAQGRMTREPTGTPGQAGRDHQHPQQQGSPRVLLRSQATNSPRHGYWTWSVVHPEGAARCSCRRAPGTRLPGMSVQGRAGNRAGDKAACNVSPRSGQESSQRSQTARDRAGHSYTWGSQVGCSGGLQPVSAFRGLGSPRQGPAARSSHGTEGMQRNSLVWVGPDP